MNTGKMKIVIFALATMVLFSGCWLIPDGPSAGVASNEAIYVMNGGSATISVIDIEEDSVYNDVALTGAWPNQIYMRGEKLYCVNSGANNVSIYDTETMATVGLIDLGVGVNPMEMVATDDDVAFVSALISQNVFKVDLTTNTVIDSFDAGVGATGIVLSNDKVYVSNTGYIPTTNSYEPGTVTVYDIATEAVVATVPVATNPQDLAVDADGRVHVLCTGDYWSEWASVKVIDPASDTVVDSLAIGNSASVIFIDDNKNTAYIGSWGGGTFAYNAETMAVVDSTFTTKGSNGIAVDEDGYVWVSSWGKNAVYRYDSLGEYVDSVAVGVGAQSLVYVKK
jgi:sugar lactone lactonase YvrE